MSEPKDLQKRLDALNRQPLPEREGPPQDLEELRRTIRKLRKQSAERRRQTVSRPIVYQRDIPRRPPASDTPYAPPGHAVGLEEAAPGAVVLCSTGRKAYLVETRLTEIDEQCRDLAEAFDRALERRDSNLRRRLDAQCALEDLAPGNLLFLDLETTGLMGTPLFLVGIMVWTDGEFAIRQYLARDYSEEPAVISLFLDAAEGKRLLVSFNGKAFDLPYLRLRAAANRMAFTFAAAHFDLLHECRRVWRGALPDCKLQTLESRVCGRTRTGDIPGEHIGEAYHAFVRTGNAAHMADILRHNVLDLATMADIMVRFPPLGS